MIEKWRGFFFCQSLDYYTPSYFWSEDKGVTWKDWNYPTNPFINNASNHDGSMILGGGQAGFIWNGDYSTRPKYRYSTDHGKSWTESLLPLVSGNSVYGVVGASFVDEKFYILGRGMSMIDSWPLLESADGLSWTRVPVSSVSTISPPTWNGETVTFTGQSSSYSYTFYRNGPTWNTSPHGMRTILCGVWYRGEFWVIEDGFGTIDLTSGNFTHVAGSEILCTTLIVHDDAIYAFWATEGWGGQANYYRWDGNEVTHHVAPISITRVAYGDGTFMIGSAFNSNPPWYSQNGIDWTQSIPPTPSDYFLSANVAFVPNGLIRGGWHIGSIGVGG